MTRLVLDVEFEVEDLGPAVSREDALELSILQLFSRLATGVLVVDGDAVVDALGSVVGVVQLLAS